MQGLSCACRDQAVHPAELRELWGFRVSPSPRVPPCPSWEEGGFVGCTFTEQVWLALMGRQLPESSGLFSLKYFSCISLQPKAPFLSPCACLKVSFPVPPCPSQVAGPPQELTRGQVSSSPGAAIGLFLLRCRWEVELPHLWRSGLEITAVIFTGDWKETLSQPGKSK